MIDKLETIIKNFHVHQKEINKNIQYNINKSLKYHYLFHPKLKQIHQYNRQLKGLLTNYKFNSIAHK